MSKKPKRTIEKRENLSAPIVELEKTSSSKILIETKPPGTIRQVWGICLLIFALVCAVYGQTLGHEFINYDDNIYVYENPAITNGLTLAGILSAFTRKEFGLWNPLATTSHMLDCQLFGLWAGGHHLTNVLLHLSSSLLLFFILRQMTGTLWRSALVAALFAVHPLRVESVAWVAERKDVLSGLFFMFTLGSYLHYLRRPESWGRYGLLILTFASGLMCKPMLVTLPFLLLLLDYWPFHRLFRNDNRELNWQVVREKIPLFAMTAGLCAVTLLGNDGAPSPDPIPFTIRMGLAPIWLVIYLGQMVWPFGLAIIYTFPEKYFLWWPGALALFGLLSLSCFLLRKTHPYLWMGWLWNFGMLVPVLGLIQISRHSQADHYNYLPQIGLYIGIVWVAAAWTKERRCPPVVLKIGTAVLLAGLTIIAFRQTSIWKNRVTLWNHMLSRNLTNYIAQNNMGTVLYGLGQKQEAIVYIREALRLNPAYADAHNNLGAIFASEKQPEAALLEYEEALHLNPYYAEAYVNRSLVFSEQGRIDAAIEGYRNALRIKPTYPEAHYSLGNALLQKGVLQEAGTHFREALRLNPSYAEAHNKRGVVLFSQGQIAGAISEFKEAIRLKQDDAEFHGNLGMALSRQNQIDAAIAEYREAIRLKPGYVEAHSNLGIIYSMLRQTDAAISEFKEAIRLRPDYAEALNNLGRILAEQKPGADASVEFREALRLRPDYAQAHKNLGDFLISQGQNKEGLSHLEKALTFEPENLQYQNDLAWALATIPQASLRNGNRALQLAITANQSTGGGMPLLLRTRAAAYAQTGNFPEAVATIKTALQLAQGQSSLEADLQHDLKLYQSRKTFSIR